ncbi:MAG TPA: hypothetical protein PKI60_04490 [Oscillospiraceae bacterium]|nr:hypothetical protein [Oscillospiraceae bacterium]
MIKKALHIAFGIVIAYAISLICLYLNVFICKHTVIGSEALTFIIVKAFPVIFIFIYVLIRQGKDFSLINIKSNFTVKKILLGILCLLIISPLGTGFFNGVISTFFYSYIFIDDPSVYLIGLFVGPSVLYLTIYSFAWFKLFTLTLFDRSMNFKSDIKGEKICPFLPL